MIAWSELSPALRSRDLSVTRTAEIPGLAGLLHDDRVPSFTALIQARLALLPTPMATAVRHWLRTRIQGGPRSRPRNEHTVRMNLNRVHPLLLDWAQNYTHLREVTTADIITATQPLTGSRRRQTLTALRSLFRHAKTAGTIFRDPRPRHPRRPAAPDPPPATPARGHQPGHRRRRHTSRPPHACPGRRPRSPPQDHPRTSPHRHPPRQPKADHHRPAPPPR
jgi:hypothetical protein